MVGLVKTSCPLSLSEVLTSRATTRVLFIADTPVEDVTAAPDGPTPSSSSSELSPSEPLSDSSLALPWFSSPDKDAHSGPSPLTLRDASWAGISGSGDSTRGNPKKSLTQGTFWSAMARRGGGISITTRSGLSAGRLFTRVI